LQKEGIPVEYAKCKYLRKRDLGFECHFPELDVAGSNPVSRSLGVRMRLHRACEPLFLLQRGSSQPPFSKVRRADCTNDWLKENHPVSPCPLFQLADGRFLLVFHNNDGTLGWPRRAATLGLLGLAQASRVESFRRPLLGTIARADTAADTRLPVRDQVTRREDVHQGRHIR
jgi:hypothetical protein